MTGTGTQGVLAVLAKFRAEHGWEPGMEWNPYRGAYEYPRPPGEPRIAPDLPDRAERRMAATEAIYREARPPRPPTGPGYCAGGCGSRPPGGGYCQACRLVAKLNDAAKRTARQDDGPPTK